MCSSNPPISDVPIDYYQYVHRRGISLIGAHTYTRPKQESAPGRWTERDDYRTFLKLVAANKIQTRPLISINLASPPATLNSTIASPVQESAWSSRSDCA